MIDLSVIEAKLEAVAEDVKEMKLLQKEMNGKVAENTEFRKAFKILGTVAVACFSVAAGVATVVGVMIAL